MSLFSLVAPLLPTLHLFVFRAYCQFVVVIYHLNSSLTEVVVSCCRCQTIHNIFFVKLLQHKPTCTVHQVFILSYQLPWHLIFCPITEVGCAFHIQVFSLSGLLPMLHLLPSISKKSKICKVYLVRLLPLARLVWLPHLASKARRASMEVFDLSLPYSPCRSI
jgi:hypothetical protein